MSSNYQQEYIYHSLVFPLDVSDSALDDDFEEFIILPGGPIGSLDSPDNLLKLLNK